jgi:hypothetical protein
MFNPSRDNLMLTSPRNMQGLTSLTIGDSLVDPQELGDNDLCPFLSETKVSFFQEPMDEILWRAVKCHLRCMRISETEHAALETKGWILFHITFYEILHSQAGEELLDLWPCGELHSDRYRQGKPRKIRESTLTVGRNFPSCSHANEYFRSLRYPVRSFPVQSQDLYTGRCCVCDPTTFLIYPIPRAGMTWLANGPTK